MCCRTSFALAGLFATLTATSIFASETVRYYDQDGQTYRETRHVYKEPVREVHYQTQEQTVYRPPAQSVRNVTDTYFVPVTKYRWEARWHNKLSLLQSPHVAYHAVPYTDWEPRQQTRQVVESTASWVPETRSVRIPVPKLRFVKKENVSRVAVGPSDAHLANATVSVRQLSPTQAFGGIARLNDEPLRQGSGDSADGWHARR